MSPVESWLLIIVMIVTIAVICYINYKEGNEK